jgi:nucleotide-binding universal stress UspA family protein
MIRTGRPAEEILAVLSGGAYDAVFVGASRPRRLRRSIADRVAGRSPVDVHVTRRLPLPIRLTWGVRMTQRNRVI